SIGTLHDITESKIAEEELEQINKVLKQERHMFISGPVIVFRWQNKEGWPVEYVSPNVKDVFGYSVEELLSGKIPYAEIIPKEDIDRVSNEVATYSKSGDENFEHKPYRIIRKDRKTIWIADYTTILRDEAGKITHYLGYIVDITERKRAEEKLKKRLNELETFNRVTVGRELKMIELKKEINELLEKSGKEAIYKIAE
ncbi:MAG: PAS domain-containing protein, partial [Candidatus Cloacimonetes bacterium]|nr:PAS domain-containing protein [Candidatus Cloacimonadota bacterium]